jgi:ABC-type multidrug transport system fused ATPase/permease subunit
MASRTEQSPDALVSSVQSALRLLPENSRGRLWLLVFANMAISILDLLGVALVGVLSWQLITFIQPDDQAASAPLATNWVPEFLSPGGLSLGLTAAIAALFFTTKSIMGALLARRILTFLARRQVVVSERLASILFRQPLVDIQRWTSQETAFSLIGGVNAAIVGLLGATALGLSEVALLVLLTVALLVLNPLVTIAAIVFFGGIAVLVHRRIGSWAAETGRELSSSTFGLTQEVQEGLTSFREITVAGRVDSYTASMSRTIARSADASATITYITQLPKYVYETSLILGAIGLGIIEFSRNSPGEAVATVTVFVAAGSRIMPSMLRLQNCLASIRASAGQATPTFLLYQELERAVRRSGEETATPEIPIGGLVPTVRLCGVSARYPDSESDALKAVDLDIRAGMSVAIVGPTGSGKSTLADVILGVLPTTSGSVEIGGVPPAAAIRRWPGKLSYVPQSVGLVSGTVRTNIAIALPDALISDTRCWEVLEAVHLAGTLRNERDGLGTVIGEHGARLSGGQRQRVGLARALYGDPRLLVLDEATSALDAETEASISSVLSTLHGTVTTIVIAHRLATVRNVDHVVYIDGGAVVAQGSFEEVRAAVPQFDRSARLLGL